MTNEQVLAETIRRCDERMAAQLEAAEVFLHDLGGTDEEVEAAVGVGGWWRRLLQENRDMQVEQVRRWLMGEDGTIH